MRTLIIDADDRFARQARTYLEDHAHHVVVAGDSTGLSTTLARWRPHLVIIDVESAEGGALDLLAAAPCQPAVLLTAAAGDGARRPIAAV